MKANEAPEKIYISNFDIEALPKDEQLSDYWHEVRTQDTDIEYIRTNVFINKALKWYCLDCECNDNCKDTKCLFYREYERYLKGEANALPPKFSNTILNEDGSTSDNWCYRHFIAKMQDAFIEKACEWIKSMWSETDDRFKEDYTGMLIENFKNYIKGK